MSTFLSLKYRDLNAENQKISCIRLINILDKLHITLDELLILHDKDYINTESFTNLVQYIRKQYSSQSIDNISRL